MGHKTISITMQLNLYGILTAVIYTLNVTAEMPSESCRRPEFNEICINEGHLTLKFSI
jgi:hypothetical protein